MSCYAAKRGRFRASIALDHSLDQRYEARWSRSRAIRQQG
jgi:hypothetical protein